AATRGDIFCTVTGGRDVIGREHFLAMKEGAIVANAGHFDVEIDLAALAELAPQRRRVRPSLDEFELPNGRRIHLLVEGRLVNLAAAEGHPASVMDLSFADQALSAEYLVGAGGELSAGVHALPEAIDREVASLKLRALGVEIDTLTEAQRSYAQGWTVGT
ncbi:MAG: adenosylhomocysteinase, partial [Myxococcota bacterium]